MTSKERVKRAIEFTSPDRLPLRYAFEPEKSDMIGTGILSAQDWKPENPDMDEWGCVWDTLSHSIVTSLGQVKEHPLSQWEGQEPVRVPDPAAPGRLDRIQRAATTYPDRYISASLGITGMNKITFLRGMEQFFVDLYLNRTLALSLIHLVFDWELAMIHRMVAIPGVDAIWFADDWGTQNALMIEPKLWREIFKPLYEKQFLAVKEAGKHVIFHSCGYVNDIIGDLIDIGADALNLNQPRLLGIDKLSQTFGGKVCFICPVDMQTTLIGGSREDIENETRLLVGKLGKGEGGFIACVDEGIDHGYIPRERIAWMQGAFARLADQAWEGYTLG
jgi:uroporphyrinogen decarboxylase